MSDYIQDPNDSNKQIPRPRTKQNYDRIVAPVAFSGSYKTPNYVQVLETISNGFGFYFGSNSDFSHSAVASGENSGKKLNYPVLSGSSYYQSFNKLPAGIYHLNPLAVSGSDADVAKVRFVYKGGPDGMGRP